MDENFRSRTELLLGRQGTEYLGQCCAAVFGLGGVGSHTAEALVRSGIGRIIIVDSDTVRPSNINRQAVAYTDTVGRKKTEVMTEILKRIDPEVTILAYDTFLLPDNIEAFFAALPCVPDYLVDCIDTVSAKLGLITYAREHGIPVISSMGTANKLHPERFRISDISATSVCPLCRVMRRELKNRGITGVDVLWSDEKPIAHGGEELGSVSFVPPAAGLIIAGHVIRSLVGISL